MPYFVYLLECRDNSYYCGYTTDLEKRVETHNKGNGAKYTSKRRPVRLIYSEEYATRTEAMRRELAIKKLGRAGKTALLAAAEIKSKSALAGN